MDSGTRRAPGGPAKGDRRRAAILDAVEELLRTRSIGELAIDQVAAQAGIGRSGFYFYFESKYAALAGALGSVWDEMAVAADAFFRGSDEDPRTFVPDALRRVGDLWRRHESLLVAMVEAAASDPGARAVWDEWIERFVSAAAARIDAERLAGRVVPGPPDATPLARALLLMNERAYYEDRRRRASEAETERMVEALSGVWLASVWGLRLDAASEAVA